MNAACVYCASDLNKTELFLKYAASTDKASQIFWHWLLKYVKLSPKNAALHNVFEYDSAAVFFDLNDDGIDEIIGTHYASATSGNGDCLLYILKKDNSKYKKISSDIYFDPTISIYISPQKNNGYYDLQVFSSLTRKTLTYSFNLQKGLYEKSKKHN